MKETNKEALPIRVSPKLKKWVKKAAAKAGKKTSPFVEDLLSEKMNKDNKIH